MQEYKVKDHASSLLPEGEWTLAWSDEFDGDTLDRSKWDFRLNFWGKPFAGYTDEGVVVRDGCVELHRVERDGVYVSPQLQTGENSFDVPKKAQTRGISGGFAETTDIWPLGELKPMKFSHTYGYYECRCKLQRYPREMWSAFWLQSPSIGTAYDAAYAGIECDIMEHPDDGFYTCGNIMGGYGAQFREEGRRHAIPTGEGEGGWHRFGLLWDEDGYVFYHNGEEISRATGTVSRVPEFILLTTEVMGHRTGKPVKVDGKFIDDAFIVDYVRVWDRVKK